MTLRNYTMNRVLARLSAQEREELLERQRAQTDAANRVGTMQMIERLTGIAGQLPGAIADESARGFGEAAAAAGPGEQELTPEARKQISQEEFYGGEVPSEQERNPFYVPPATPSVTKQVLEKSSASPEARKEISQEEFYNGNIPGQEHRNPFYAPPEVPQINWAVEQEPVLGQSKLHGVRPKSYNDAQTEEDFKRSVSGIKPDVGASIERLSGVVPAGAAAMPGSIPDNATEGFDEVIRGGNATTTDLMSVPAARPAVTPYRAPPGKGPAGPGTALKGTEFEDNLSELDRKLKAKEISQAEYDKFVASKRGGDLSTLDEPETIRVRYNAPAEQTAVKQDAADEEVDPVVEGTKEEAAAQTVGARTYAPLKWKRTPEEEAQVQLQEIIRLKRPHPLLNILSLGQAQNKFDLARSVALKQAAKVIRGERRVLENDHLNVFKAERVGTAGKTPEQIAAEIEYKQAQAELSRERAKKVGLDVTVKSALKKADRDALVGGKQFLRESNRLVESGKKLLEKDKKTGKAPGFPFGSVRQAASAGIEALGSIESQAGQDQRTRQVGGSAGVAGIGAAAGETDATSRPVGGKVLDAEKFNDAWEKIDMTNMSSEQRYFMSQLKTVIQGAGKTREGKSLTDKDLEFYLKNLVTTSDPSVALRQINQLAEDAAMNYSLNLDSLKRATTDGVVPGFEGQEVMTFSPEDISAASESEFGSTSLWIDQNQPQRLGGTSRPVDSAATTAFDAVKDLVGGGSPPPNKKTSPGRQSAAVPPAGTVMGSMPGIARGPKGELYKWNGTVWERRR